MESIDSAFADIATGSHATSELLEELRCRGLSDAAIEAGIRRARQRYIPAQSSESKNQECDSRSARQAHT